MKKILLAAIICFAFITGKAQIFSKITLTETGNIVSISFDLDENVLVNITPDGAIDKWGTDLYRGRYQVNNLEKLEPYTGRVEYYTENDNEAFRGKIKFIGRTLITYYASYDDETLTGKIKSIGAVKIDYYPKYENDAFKGRIKSVGSVLITYYPAFGNDPNAGKLKSAGGTTLSYYGQFEDKAYQGKIKSIGSYSYVFYPSNEANTQLRGRLKTGSQIQAVNGLRYFIKLM